MILEDVTAAALEKASDIKVADVRIGLGYTAVQLDTGSVGLAGTVRDVLETGCTVFQGKRPVAGSPVRDVLPYMSSASMLERGVGLAAANALLNTPDEIRKLQQDFKSLQGDFLDAVSLTKQDRVGMVGFFGPLVPVIRQQAGELIIFEKNISRAEGLYPEEKAGELLPSCSVVIITATSLVNQSFDHLADYASGCRVKAVLGPSTPMVPGIFRKRGITHLSGVVANDVPAILRVVSEAGGTRFFMKYSKKVNLVLEGN